LEELSCELVKQLQTRCHRKFYLAHEVNPGRRNEANHGQFCSQIKETNVLLY
jgi:hypothetical protein